jgi:hypothetical protein
MSGPWGAASRTLWPSALSQSIFGAVAQPPIAAHSATNAQVLRCIQGQRLKISRIDCELRVAKGATAALRLGFCVHWRNSALMERQLKTQPSNRLTPTSAAPLS